MLNIVFNWFAFLCIGLFAWKCTILMEYKKAPILKAIVTSFGRLALSVPLAIGAGFFGLLSGALSGDKGMLQFALLFAIFLAIWSITPLFCISKSEEVPRHPDEQVIEIVGPNIQHAENVHRVEKPQEDERQAPVEQSSILEASDVRRFIATASEKRIHSAQADYTGVTRFFNAIRYGKISVVRETVSANPLIVLAKDVNGNTPLEVAKLERNMELESFFNECLL